MHSVSFFFFTVHIFSRCRVVTCELALLYRALRFILWLIMTWNLCKCYYFEHLFEWGLLWGFLYSRNYNCRSKGWREMHVLDTHACIYSHFTSVSYRMHCRICRPVGATRRTVIQGGALAIQCVLKLTLDGTVPIVISTLYLLTLSFSDNACYIIYCPHFPCSHSGSVRCSLSSTNNSHLLFILNLLKHIVLFPKVKV